MYVTQGDGNLAGGNGGRKRERFRVEIRRRAIEQYQQRIRKQWQMYQASQMDLYQPPKDYCFKQETDDQQEELQQQITDIIQQLEQLCLTHPQQLCIESTLKYLMRASQKNSEHTLPRIGRVLLKISVNELYWTQQFLVQLFGLLERLRGKLDVLALLTTISECAIVQFKAITYDLLMNSKFVDPLSESQSNVSGKYSNGLCHESRVLAIVSNLLTAPPPVQLSPQQIPRLIALLTALSKPLGSQPRPDHRAHLSILELLHQVCHRLEHRQLAPILLALQSQEPSWKLLHILITISKPMDRTMETRIKFKIMQIVQTIVQFCIYEQQYGPTGLDFLYAFLPTLLAIIEPDLASYRTGSRPKQDSLDSKYEYILLETFYALINLKDELNRLPALQFLALKSPTLLEQIFEQYCQANQVEVKKRRMGLWICEVALGCLSGFCQMSWACTFITTTLLSRKEESDRDLLQSILEATLHSLQSHGHTSPCPLMRSLQQAHVKSKLEQIASQFSGQKDEQEIQRMAESILAMVGEGQQDGI